MHTEEQNSISTDEWHAFVSGSKATKSSLNLTEEELRTKFCTLETWADQPMIEFVSRELELNILFYNVDTRQMFCGVHGKKSQRTILIAWVSQQHFEPMCSISSFTKHDNAFKDVTLKFVFNADNAEDKEFLDDLFGHYESSCEMTIPN